MMILKRTAISIVPLANGSASIFTPNYLISVQRKKEQFLRMQLDDRGTVEPNSILSIFYNRSEDFPSITQ